MTRRLSLGLLVFLLYLANGRVLAEIDCVAAPYTAWAMVRHQSLDLSRYQELRRFVENGALWETADGGWVTIRPVGSAIAALPLVAPLAIVRDAPFSHVAMLHIGKLVAAAFVAWTVVIFWALCRELAPTATGPATVLLAFGTVLWTVASQALWTHGPATFGVMFALAQLLPSRPDAGSSRRALTAGLAFAFAILCRETTIVFAAAAVVAFIWHRRWTEASIVAACAGGVSLVLAAYNQTVFGHLILGGYANDGWGRGTPLLGIVGLVVAPSRGVLVYSPALVIGAWGLRAVRTRPRFERTLLWLMGAAVLITLVFYGSWHDWRGGWSYGPRFLAETMPVLCLLFALGYSTLRPRGQRLAQALVVLSVLVQVAGVAGYSAHAPWHQRHDLNDQGRSLFSLRDTEIEAHTRAAAGVIRRILTSG